MATRVQRVNELYQLMIGQLCYDGFGDIGKQLADVLQQQRQQQPPEQAVPMPEDPAETAADSPAAAGAAAASAGDAAASRPPPVVFASPDSLAPTNRLEKLVVAALDQESVLQEMLGSHGTTAQQAATLDFEAADDDNAQFNPFTLQFSLDHSAPCRTASFDHTGNLVATGCADGTVKIVDVNRVLQNARDTSLPPRDPVVRVFHDHQRAVNAIHFHPSSDLILSAGKDRMVYFHDFSSIGTGKPSRHIRESHNVRTLSIHPSGRFILVGTDHWTVRLYDVETAQCFANPHVGDHHTAPINHVTYAPDATTYATCCAAGVIRLWDGVSNRCTASFDSLHDGCAVSSVQFAKNGYYLLSSGGDDICRLLDLRTGRELQQYTGAKHEHNRLPAVLSFDETLVASPSESPAQVLLWDAKTGQERQRLASGGINLIRSVAASPNLPVFVSCCADHRADFWMPKELLASKYNE